MSNVGTVAASGTLGVQVIRKPQPSSVGTVAPSGAIAVVKPAPLRAEWYRNFWSLALPHFGLGREVNVWRVTNLLHLWRGLWRVGLAYVFGIPTMFGALYLEVLRRDGQRQSFGLASLRVVTTTGCGFVIDAFQNLVEMEAMTYHGIGTGGAAEAVGNTALTTELTTEYVSNNTRATGVWSEASALVGRNIGTNTVDAAVAITEHGLFSSATSGAGVVLDRTLFTVINLASGESLQTTYDFTMVAGG